MGSFIFTVLWFFISIAFLTMFIITIVRIVKKGNIKVPLISSIVLFLVGFACFVGIFVALPVSDDYTVSKNDTETIDKAKNTTNKNSESKPTKQSTEEKSTVELSTEEVKTEEKSTVEPSTEEVKTEEKEDNKPNREQKAALNSAKSYSEYLNMSKEGIFEQLTSKAGDKYPEDIARYAVENLKADYKKNALESAKSYINIMDMSNEELYDQLTSSAGDKFTPEEAQYAIDNLDK
ncbi:Ltp family lipoprotein [Mammaliicoccus lentus]|uniref:Ltp family lipoprotein n=1 Tax=Mammaliicoccus lentus TaxID=42858 RepID=UPI0024A89052|nr:Ltp family lipoprotein [Mammaliicoccus lentus]WHI53885.1 Ltp family lipoprotein [Mammaliicoccus lentus]WHI56474.1 Ltp family lipoprotein [Mammaliicoccus lentus]WHI64321.1 Ltp family lipoprotein [Mammaliicoccus lentus]WHI85214.1 Ltp family lipoprotein [Mammaliicoccus lentus]WHI89722.1 Ltp family lipoprotein [Mammaliicoccus lentus]